MRLRIVILGLSITSSWGNGHATIYRGLVRELAARGHDVLFLEYDKPWYAAHRDEAFPTGGGRIELYAGAEDLKRRFGGALEAADCVMVGSYVPEGIEIGRWITEHAGGVSIFYDIDTPVTQAAIALESCEYLSAEVASHYDAYLSFTGGPILNEIESAFGLRVVRPFYCCVDPALYYPEPCGKQFDLGYLGTYCRDRQPRLDELLVNPAKLDSQSRFAVAGPLYPETLAWPPNVRRLSHVAPGEHRAFYGVQRFTLNLTREDMLRWGYSPSVRLFEAAACGVPIITDRWPGLDTFFVPGKEILTADTGAEVLDFLHELGDRKAQAIAQRARRRVLKEHTAARRAAELENLVAELSCNQKPSYGKP